MQNNKLGIIQYKKKTVDKNNPFIMPEVSDSLGIVEFTFEGSKYKEGDKVHFGSQREMIRMAGMDIMIMGEDNIYAIVEE